MTSHFVQAAAEVAKQKAAADEEAKAQALVEKAAAEKVVPLGGARVQSAPCALQLAHLVRSARHLAD